MRMKYVTCLFIIPAVMMLFGCGAGNYSEPVPPVAVNRTYEKVEPSPAVVAEFYDLSLKLDTENDRLSEKVSIVIQNNTNSRVDTVYLRYNPMGYFDYLCEANPEVADANKDKKAGITSIKFEGGDKELTAEYLLDDTSVKINLADDAMEPGEKRTLFVEAWTDIPDVENRFGVLRRNEGKMYALALCFPYVDCSSDGMWQIDPPLYLGGGGENRNPDFRNYHVEIDVPEQFEVACAGEPTRKGGIVSVDLENIRDFAVFISDFMDVDTFETQGVTIRNYYLKAGDTEAYREISKQTIIDSFEFYTDLLGDYQRKEYSMAQFIDGMEYSGFAVVDGRNLMDGGPDNGNKLMRNTAHEVGHSWFYDAVGNNEYNEGWIDEGIVSYLASRELVLKEIEAYKTEKKHGSDWTIKDQIKAVKESDDLVEKNQLKTLDHCYLNTPWYVYPENSDPGNTEYLYTPIFLGHAKEIMGEEAFNSFLREVYQTYAMKIVHSEDILKILRKYDNSSKMNELLAFYFNETATETEKESAIQKDGNDELFLSLTEGTSKSLSFSLTEEQAARVEKAGADRVTWTLHRTESYGNPADGKFIPLHGEEKMYPNEKETIDFASIRYSDLYESGQAFSMEKFETTLDGSVLKLDFSTTPIASEGRPGMPHESGGRFMDICGKFSLTAELDGVTLTSLENVTIKPYPSFHTMWEIYDELLRLSKEGDDDSTTAKPYVEYGVMGQSYLGYDMPYLIVARDSDSVKKWLNLSEKAEETGTAAIEELQSTGDDDYQVPVMYSNIHANEVAATDGVLEFARLLIEEQDIEYTKLTGFTEEGKAKSEEQRKDWNIYTPKLTADKYNYLGSIWANEMQDSAKVEGFDRYYTSEKTNVNVRDLLDDVFFILVPEENVDARIYFTRTSANGINLNRDNNFQVMPETQNMQHLIGTYDPVTLLELHGVVPAFQVEPSTPPHQPNFEYDILVRNLMAGGEAFGAAAVANNPSYQSYVILDRDYMRIDEGGTPYWIIGGDDYPTMYTPTYAALHGCVGYTAEMPTYSEDTRQAGTYGLLGLADYVAANKASYFENLAEIYSRGIENKNSDAEVSPWYVDEQDNAGAEAEFMRPEHTGKGENGQFFPECYLIPLDSENQTNLLAAYDMIEYLTRNDVKVSIADAPVTAEGKTFPAGTAVVSMYQAKRSVANNALFDGNVFTGWEAMSNETVLDFSYLRGFDMVTCVKPAEYEAIAGTLSQTVTYDTLKSFLQENAVSQFSGEEGADVIISNASEDSTAAVNSLLDSGRQVGMITEGAYKGDFICSYDDWKNVSDDYILTGTGVKNASITAYVIEKAPSVYISGTKDALIPSSEGFIYNTLVTLSSSYNLDRTAMELMGFSITEDPASADAVVGYSALDEESLAAVKTGVPYVGYSEEATEIIQESLLPDVETDAAFGVDCLGYVTYPEETLINASYIRDGDDIFYGVGLNYFTALPEGAKVLVQRDGSRAPLEGHLTDSEEKMNAFLNGIMGFSYVGKDKDGNDVNITLFANSMTNMAHQRDEYVFISNALFASFLTETPYANTSSAGN